MAAAAAWEQHPWEWLLREQRQWEQRQWEQQLHGDSVELQNYAVLQLFTP
jgi:hypothetical protein